MTDSANKSGLNSMSKGIRPFLSKQNAEKKPIESS